MLLLLILLMLFSMTLASPTPTTFRQHRKNCTALVEDTPWHITNIVHFQATHPKKDCENYLKFHFHDVNKGLEFKTECERYVGSNETVVDKEYYACKDEYVHFIFLGESFQVSRYYEDDCLGEYPYNSAIAYGRANTNFTKIRVEDGVLSTQTVMHMPISSMS